MENLIPIEVITSHEVFKLWGSPEQKIGQVLQRAGIPLSCVCTYATAPHPDWKDGSTPAGPQFVSVNESLGNTGKVIARVSRNIDLSRFINRERQRIREVENPTTEWRFPSEEGAFEPVLTQMSADECLAFVRKGVSEVLSQMPDGLTPKMVVGVSGGGDSNCLLSSLLECTRPENIVPVMMLGIPDWDQQRHLAEKLCRDASLELNIIEAPQVARLCGASSVVDLRRSFEREFPEVDREFLGTWMLRRVLGGYARELGSNVVIIGANREDLIGEGFARIAAGKLPLPTPYRKIGDLTFVYPMWKVPKKIGDGAFLNYSVENYENRYPSFNKGRALYYFLAYGLSDLLPGMDLTLLQGFSEIAKLDPAPFITDDSLKDYVCRDSYDMEQVQRWKRFLDSVMPKPDADYQGGHE